MKKVVMVTGATSGIGAATARLFAENGYNLLITGRRVGRLKDLKQELKAKHPGINVHPLSFDVKDRRGVEAALSSLPEEFRRIDVLVNNAGKASDMVKIQSGDLHNWDDVIDTNIKGLVYVTRLVSEQMAANGGGHIVNIGSIAGTEPYECGNIYCATKHAVHALSQSMRIDLLGTGIKVTEVRPGKVETEFSLVRFRGDEEMARRTYEGYEPLTGEDIAQTIFWAVSQPDHVNIDEIVVTPKAQANSYYLKINN